MSPSRHVVLVTVGERDARRWRRAAQAAPLAALAEPALGGFTWHVFDCCRPSGPRDASLRVRRRRGSPTVQADRLARFLAEAPFVAERPMLDPEITLVGAGPGCRVVRQFVVGTFRPPDPAASTSESTDVRAVRRLRQVMLVNPPWMDLARWTFVAAVVFGVVAAVAALPQAQQAVPWLANVAAGAVVMGVLLGAVWTLMASEEARRTAHVAELPRPDGRLVHDYERVVEHGAKSIPGTWPIPTRTVRLDPLDADDAQQLAEAVRHPPAHPNLDDVDLFERRTAVRPVTLRDVPPDVVAAAKRVGRPAAVEDNAADYRAAVRFSAANARGRESPLPKWRLTYGTSAGLVLVDAVHADNEWTREERLDYETHLLRYKYCFQPDCFGEHVLEARVYGGYTGAHQCGHAHLRADTYYRQVREELDLRAYVRAGWRLAAPPEVTFTCDLPPKVFPSGGKDRDVHGPNCDCAEKDTTQQERREVPVVELEPGLYRWAVDSVCHGGVLSYRYHLIQEPHDARALAGHAAAIG